MTAHPLFVDVFADIACPWCWIGEHRLDDGLAAVTAQRPNVRVSRRWRPFQLQPGLPRPGVPWAPFAHEKFGGAPGMAAAVGQVTAAGAAAGVDFRFDRVVTAPNTVDAHRVVLYTADTQPADERGALRMADALFTAYFRDGRHVGEPAVLVDVAAEQGLDRAEVAAMLASARYTAEVQGAQVEAARLGVRGVPLVVFNGRYAVSGAQSAEVFVRAAAVALDDETG